MTQRNGAATQVLPPALRAAFYRSLAKDAGAAYDVNAKGCATLPKAKLTACFNSSGVHFTGAGSLALNLVGYGRGQALSPVKTVQPETKDNRVSYKHGNLTEWWRVLPVGFEQGFTVAKRPAGHGELRLALAANNKASKNNDTLSWGKLHYGGLVVTDAKGRVIPATLKAKGDRVLIAVNDARAAYPITVDPLVWIEQKVIASDGAANAHFGYEAAIEGTTALVAAPYATVNGNSTQGAVYVFTESDGIWTQAQTLVPGDGAPFDEFGSAIAIDGNVAVISSPLKNIKGNTWQGAAYIFTESDGTWTQTQRLTASDGTEFGTFGQGVALGGTTAFVAAGGASVNGNPVPSTVYVFNYSGGTWTQTQQIDSPNEPGDEFGFHMDISGTDAVVGAYAASPHGNQAQGNAFVYEESDGTWALTQQLIGSDSGAGDYFGVGVAIQGDTILVGAENAKAAEGEAYVFTRSDGTWTEAQHFTADDATSGYYFGSFVALDGPRALIGAVGYNSLEGKAYVFTNSNGTWTQTQGLIPSDNPTGAIFGFAGALSGTTALVGAHGVSSYQGAAYFYGGSNLGLAVSAPQTIGQGQQYTSQTIATNSSSVASPAVSATITVPAAASFVSATATQGSCNEDSGVVTCDFGQIPANAGMATANVTLKATGASGTTIENTASIAKATPPLTASAATTIGEGGACQAGYTEFSGHLDAGQSFTSAPITVTEAGQKYVDLTSPASFAFFAITTTSYGQHTYVYPHVKHGHRWGAAGSYQVGVQAGPDAGGDYTLCVNLNPAQ